jgi:hypothetical protein
VIAPPGILTGTGRATVNGAIVCVQGDEASAMVVGAAYMTPAFPTPGLGILTITGLAPDQVSTKATTGGRAVLLRGSRFQAQLQVLAPAVNPGSGAPDPVPLYVGSGSFMTTNVKAQGE